MSIVVHCNDQRYFGNANAFALRGNPYQFTCTAHMLSEWSITPVCFEW